MKKIKKLSDLTKKQLASLIDDFCKNHPDLFYDHSGFWRLLKIPKEELIEVVVNLYDITIYDSGFIYIVEKKL